MTKVSPLTEEQKLWLNNFLLNALDIKDWGFQDFFADASFRSYSRIVCTRENKPWSLILMYFPAHKEDGDRIISTSQFLTEHGIRVPLIYGYDLALGVILQEDMGKELLAHRNMREVDCKLYMQALCELELLQKLDATSFGIFDEKALLAEMRLFSQWFLRKWLGEEVNSDFSMLEDLYSFLADCLVRAPQCCVHFDFHSRNLCVMPAPDHQGEINTEIEVLGVLDYQDMQQGHFCYDIWSLLCDAYILLPQELKQQLFSEFSKKACRRFDLPPSFVLRHYNLIGVQRCLKVCGIFARLYLRDEKDSYLPHIPLVLRHLRDALLHLDNFTDTESENIPPTMRKTLLLLLEELSQPVKNKLAKVNSK